MEKKPFVTLEQLQEITKKYPTPFYLYDEKGIRENARRLKEAFSWNKGYKEYFAVKATPNPFILNILKEFGCGTDCSSMTELKMSEACGFSGSDIMFSSNDTPLEEFAYADKLGAIINLDDITHVECVEKTLGYIPETISCRFNPGGVFKISNDIMDNPGDSKYGMTTEQIFEAFKILKEKGARHFGIHAFLASNTVTNEYYPMLAKILFELAVRLHEETGAHISFINLSGGIGIPYRPDQEPNDIRVIGEGVRQVYEEILVPAGMGDVALCTELGRFMLGPYGCLVTKAIHEKHTHKEYAGVDACAVNLMRPAMYGAMAAILALDAAVIEEVTASMEDVWIANYNCPGQIVISGRKEAVEEACERLKAAGAKRAILLNVSGPFHSGMLTEAGEKLGQVLLQTEIKSLQIPYVANVTAQYVTEAAPVKELLTRQVSSSVKWQQSVETMLADGVDTFVEIGPGRTLTGFMRKIDRAARCFNVEKLEDIDKVAEALKEA